MKNSRLAKFREMMAKANLDAFIVSGKANRYYLTGFTGTYGRALLTADQQFIVADGRYFEQLKTQSPEFTVIDNQMRMNETFKTELNSLGIGSVGIEGEEINVSEYLGIRSDSYEVVLTKDLIEHLRMIKDETEQQKIEQAGQIADETFEYILGYIRPGMTEKQVANEIDQYGISIGADGPAFETIVASGVRSALPHGHASDKVIQSGELIILDCGFEYQSYFSDITRTIAMGPVEPKLREIYDLTLAAQEAAIHGLSEGMKLSAVDKIARDYITAKGYGENFLHGTGHGLGLTVHEYPLLNSDSEETLKRGMTFTVEPGIYLAGLGGVRIEDDILFEQTGPRSMTSSDKSWIEI